jgi:hypothetical protein
VSAKKAAKATKKKPYEGAGRPPLVARGVEPETLYVRCTPHQIASLDRMVAEFGLTMRAVVVRALIETAASDPKVLESVRRWLKTGKAGG